MKSLLFIITSVIDTPNIPLSYSAIRSIYTRDERFEQTKKTISSIKEKIPEAKLMIVECSNYETNKEQLDYLIDNSDYFFNLWDNQELHKYIFGTSKALAEGMMTIELINYINNNNIIFDNYAKISGRYYLNDNFNINLNNDKPIIATIWLENYTSLLYKINYKYLFLLKEHLISYLNKMIEFYSFELIFRDFFLKYSDDVEKQSLEGVSGNITVDGTKFN